VNDTITDRQQFRQLAELYAQAVDSNRPEVLDAIMSVDAVIEGPGFIPAMLKKHYRRTRHEIHNQTTTIDGEQASGETYSTASHLLRDEKDQVLVWHVRYLDVFCRRNGQWIFLSRKLEIDWTEVRSIVPA